jgi:methionyl-tRNA formyltransferase
LSDQQKRIVFMGSPFYAEVILKALLERFDVIGVVTQPDKKVGRGKTIQSPPVKILSAERTIPCLQPERLSHPDVLDVLRKWDPDLIVVAAYGKILRKDVLEFPRFKCVNVHASLLPKWRGASPIHSAILSGDQKTGVTIMKMDEGIDTGDILTQKEIQIEDNDTTETLTEKLAFAGGQLLVETLPNYFSGIITPLQQNESLASYTRMVAKDDGMLDFSKSAQELERQVRAYIPWPVSFFTWNQSNIRVYKAKVLESSMLSTGQNGIIGKYPCIGTGKNDLQLRKVQAPGKKMMDGKAFLNGTRNWLEKSQIN